MSDSFLCPLCSAGVQYDEQRQGHKLKCPACRVAEFEMPAKGQKARLIEGAQHLPPLLWELKNAAQRSDQWLEKIHSWVVLLGVVFLCVIGIAAIAGFLAAVAD